MNREEEKEQWKDIEGYEGLYQVSDKGRIWSIRKRICRKSRKDKEGYLEVCLYNKGGFKHKRVHQLVAETFIPNPENKTEVHHIDGNPSNNSVDNLMWVTQDEHAALHLNWEKKTKTVYQYSPDGKLIKVWPSTEEIHRQLGYKQSCIWCCTNGKHKTAYGFIWSYRISSQFP